MLETDHLENDSCMEKMKEIQESREVRLTREVRLESMTELQENILEILENISSALWFFWAATTWEFTSGGSLLVNSVNSVNSALFCENSAEF